MDDNSSTAMEARFHGPDATEKLQQDIKAVALAADSSGREKTALVMPGSTDGRP
jgi:hypothetical protein